MVKAVLAVVTAILVDALVVGFVVVAPPGGSSRLSTSSVRLFSETNVRRRQVIGNILSAGGGLFTATTALPQNANAVERAIGAAEAKCREQGNCLETFDIDGGKRICAL